MGAFRLGLAAILGLVASVATAHAAGSPCRSPFSGPAQLAVCQDPQLLKLDEATSRKVDALRTRITYGQYLGLRYWRTRGLEVRDQCGPDRVCLAEHYRAQNRFLDRLRQCIDGGAGKRTCWRAVLDGNVASPR